jgi:hypothetical protein
MQRARARQVSSVAAGRRRGSSRPEERRRQRLRPARLGGRQVQAAHGGVQGAGRGAQGGARKARPRRRHRAGHDVRRLAPGLGQLRACECACECGGSGRRKRHIRADSRERAFGGGGWRGEARAPLASHALLHPFPTDPTLQGPPLSLQALPLPRITPAQPPHSLPHTPTCSRCAPHRVLPQRVHLVHALRLPVLELQHALHQVAGLFLQGGAPRGRRRRLRGARLRGLGLGSGFGFGWGGAGRPRIKGVSMCATGAW